MKQVYLLALLFSFSFAASAQNMVPNGSFETYSSCPTGLSQVTSNLANGWYAYTTATPDYMNACNTGTSVSVPTNFRGYEPAAHGQAYVGGYDNFSSTSTYVEYVGATITPLTIGATYEVSMSVSLAELSSNGGSNLGIYFFKNAPTFISTTFSLPVTPQVSYSGFGTISTTSGWVRLTANFLADSAYDHIVIGGFGTFSSTGTIAAYYYFDSIVIKSTSHISMVYTDTLLCAGDTIYVPYTVNPTNYFNTNNTFTLQLSNSSGSFASPVNIGTRTGNTGGTITGIIPTGTTSGTGYRIRIIAGSPGDTSGTNGKNIAIGNPKPAKPVSSNNGPVCSGATLNLAATTTTTGVSWKWIGPNSFTSAQQNPSITNAQPVNSGSYIVTAYIYGCTAKDTTVANVLSSPAPAGIVAGSNSPICDNDTLNLTATNSTTGATYGWTGPLSYTSSQQNPSIIHPPATASGDYIVTANLNGCIAKDTVTILVKPTPVGLTASSNSPVCNGDSIKLFAGSTTSGITYLWTGPNAYSAFAQNPAISNAASIHAGDYIISYLLNGCNAKDTVTVVVNPKPSPLSATVNGPICAGATLSLTSSTTTSGVSYNWTGPNSFTAATQNPNITNAQTAASGDYIVTAALGLCTVKDTVTALVKPMPANTGASNNSPVCQGSTLSLAANTTSAGATFSWTGPNSFSSVQQNPNISNSQPVATGLYTVTFNLNGCSSNANTSAIVTAIPAKPTAGSNTPVCDGTTLNLTASTVPGTTYSWTGPAGFNSLLQNPALNNVSPTNAGLYIVRSVSNGCYSIPDTATVTIIPAPNVNIYPNPNDTICLGSNVTFVAVASNAGSSTSYRWLRNNNPIAGATTGSYSSTGIADGDVIFCEMTAAGVCPSVYKDSSNKITMKVLPWLAPSVSITSNPSTPLSPYQLVTFTANATNAGTAPGYQWKRNGTDVVGATSFTWGTHQLSDNDDISVVVTSSYMCPQPPTATSNVIKVTVLTGIDDAANKNKLALYPNPNNGSFTIRGSFANAVDLKLDIINAVGQTVFQTKPLLSNREMNEQINVQHLASGVYVLRIQSNDAVQNIRFVVDRK